MSQHGKSDAFFMVAMSHGHENRTLQLRDGKLINIDKELVAEFDGENWPVMIGKPKVFLFQCCRGQGGNIESFKYRATVTE